MRVLLLAYLPVLTGEPRPWQPQVPQQGAEAEGLVQVALLFPLPRSIGAYGVTPLGQMILWWHLWRACPRDLLVWLLAQAEGADAPAHERGCPDV